GVGLLDLHPTPAEARDARGVDYLDLGALAGRRVAIAYRYYVADSGPVDREVLDVDVLVRPDHRDGRGPVPRRLVECEPERAARPMPAIAHRPADEVGEALERLKQRHRLLRIRCDEEAGRPRHDELHDAGA